MMFVTAVKGNLVVNGGFETGTVGAPLADWQSSNVAIVGATLAHTGSQAAFLGQVTPPTPQCSFRISRLSRVDVIGSRLRGA